MHYKTLTKRELVDILNEYDDDEFVFISQGNNLCGIEVDSNSDYGDERIELVPTNAAILVD